VEKAKDTLGDVMQNWKIAMIELGSGDY